MTITADSLRQAMGCTAARAAEMLPHYTAGALAANATTVRRAAMFAAQIGHESLGLHYMEEIADGSAYEGRKDLGNTQRGDGRRFKGRGPIQLTGRTNYGSFSRWCHGRGLVDAADFFVRNPERVAEPRWGFLAASWYWTVARPRINGLCDAGDLVGVTRQINGGTHGLADREDRWERCVRLGDAIVPDGACPPAPPRPASSSGARRRPNRGDTLRVGDIGPEVGRWQAHLDAMYSRFGDLRADEDFGPATEHFTRQVQAYLGLDDDAVVGPATKKATRFPA